MISLVIVIALIFGTQAITVLAVVYLLRRNARRWRELGLLRPTDDAIADVVNQGESHNDINDHDSHPSKEFRINWALTPQPTDIVPPTPYIRTIELPPPYGHVFSQNADGTYELADLIDPIYKLSDGTIDTAILEGLDRETLALFDVDLTYLPLPL